MARKPFFVSNLFYTFFHRAAACCRGIKLLLIRRSRLALFARLRRFCVCALINDSRLLHWCSILRVISSCSKLLGVIYRQFFVFNLLLYVLSSRERTKAPGTRKNQSQQPSAHESQATSFVRLLFASNSFSFNHRGQKNSLFTQ